MPALTARTVTKAGATIFTVAQLKAIGRFHNIVGQHPSLLFGAAV